MRQLFRRLLSFLSINSLENKRERRLRSNRKSGKKTLKAKFCLYRQSKPRFVSPFSPTKKSFELLRIRTLNPANKNKACDAKTIRPDTYMKNFLKMKRKCGEA